jgi:hypothetical protein
MIEPRFGDLTARGIARINENDSFHFDSSPILIGRA